MNKKVLISGIFISALFLSGCDLYQLPKKINITSSANYNFNLLNFDYPLEELFSPTALLSSLAAGSDMEVYDYNPGKNQKIQKYLIRMPVQEIPLDFGSYLNQTDFGKNFEEMSFSQEVEIPEFSYDEKEALDIQQVNEMINTLVTFDGASGTYVKIEIDNGDFSTIEYESGIMEVTAPSVQDGTVVKIVEVDDIDHPTAITRTVVTGTFSGGTALIDLNNVVLNKNNSMLSFGSEQDKAFIAKIREGSKIKKCTGITVIDASIIPDIPITDTLEIGEIESLDNCIFGSGSKLEFGIDFPSSWTGITVNFDYDFKEQIPTGSSITDGLDLTGTAASQINLENKKYYFNDIDISLNAKLQLTNASIDFSKNPEIYSKIIVPSFNSVEIVVDDSVKTDINVNNPVSEEIQKMVNAIYWKEGCGIQIKYTNTFPTGNDFSLTNVKSDFIGLNITGSNALQAGKTDEVLDLVTSSSTVTNISSFTNIDFSAKLNLPGNKNHKIVLTNAVCKEKYKVELKITTKLDWEKIQIKNNATEQKGTKYFDYNIADVFNEFDNILGTSLKDKISLNDAVELYLFCDIPETTLFNNPGFIGKIKAYASYNNGAGFSEIEGIDTEYLLGSDTDTEKLLSNPENNYEIDDKNTITSVVTGDKKIDLRPMLNEAKESNKPNTNICINYNLFFDAGNSESFIEFTKDDLINSPTTSIKLTAVILLSLDFNLSASDNVDVMNLASSLGEGEGEGGASGTPEQNDIFGRTSASEMDKIEYFLSIVEESSIGFKTTKNPFISDTPILIQLDMDGDSGTAFEQVSLSLEDGKYTTSPKTLIETYPLCPSVKMTLPAGRFAISRDLTFGTNIKLGIKTNGKPLTIFPFGGEG